MGLFSKKNPNEVNYVGSKKHFSDIIKNSGPGELLIWLNGEEDFNNNSTLIVSESEEALFYKDGIIEQVFEAGKYNLTTNNYPFLSRVRNAMTGGISAFNCKVYFVRKAHSMEILWGTDSPIQVRDPIQMIATSIQARGSMKIQIKDSKKFLIKLLGNNVPFMTQYELTDYFRSEFMQYIKSNIARYIKESNDEILGICAEQDKLANSLIPILEEPLDDYGIKLVSFTIAAIDIPENDPNRQKLEDSYAAKRQDTIWGQDTNKLFARQLLTDIANNPGAGGMATMGAGMGMGMGVAPIIGSMAQQAFTPVKQVVQQHEPVQTSQPSGRFVQQGAVNANQEGCHCSNCGAQNMTGAKFCNECGTKFQINTFCSNCGTSIQSGSKFCNECGTRIV